MTTTERFLQYLEYRRDSRNILGFVNRTYVEYCREPPSVRLLRLQGEEEAKVHAETARLAALGTLPVLP
jgi:hypothetical protein